MVGVCARCGAGDAKARCSRCKIVVYCSRKCQAADWKRHKKMCGTKQQQWKEQGGFGRAPDLGSPAGRAAAAITRHAAAVTAATRAGAADARAAHVAALQDAVRDVREAHDAATMRGRYAAPPHPAVMRALADAVVPAGAPERGTALLGELAFDLFPLVLWPVADAAAAGGGGGSGGGGPGGGGGGGGGHEGVVLAKRLLDAFRASATHARRHAGARAAARRKNLEDVAAQCAEAAARGAGDDEERAALERALAESRREAGLGAGGGAGGAAVSAKELYLMALGECDAFARGPRAGAGGARAGAARLRVLLDVLRVAVARRKKFALRHTRHT